MIARILSVLSLVIIVSGCANLSYEAEHTSEQVISKEDSNIKKWVEQNTQYDPYSNEVHIDSNELNNRFDSMEKRIRSKIYPLGVSRFVLGQDVVPDIQCKTKSDAPICLWLGNAIDRLNMPSKFNEQAYKQAFSQGYVLVQKDYPVGDLNFGSYKVPVVFIYYHNYGVINDWNTSVQTYNFDITKNASNTMRQQKPSQKLTNENDNSPKLAERLQQLKEMNKQGLITDKEYQAKKDQMLKSF